MADWATGVEHDHELVVCKERAVAQTCNKGLVKHRDAITQRAVSAACRAIDFGALLRDEACACARCPALVRLVDARVVQAVARARRGL